MGFEPTAFRLGEESSLKKCRKEAPFHTTILKTHSVTHSPEQEAGNLLSIAFSIRYTHYTINQL